MSSYAIDDGERLLLFDPLAVPSELEDLAADRETAIVLTAPWHERDAESLVQRLGAPVYTPLPDSAQFLMDTYGLTAEQAGDGSPDVVWLLREGKGEARPYSTGDRLPFGADVFPGHKTNDTVLWIESQRAVISGDTLVDFGQGLEINERWLQPGVTREEIAAGAAPAPRAAGRARARDARRAVRPGRPRARVVPCLHNKGSAADALDPRLALKVLVRVRGRDNGPMEAVDIFGAENLEGRIDVARAVGSTATVMFIYDLAPGQSSCPYHYEYEEEWLLVIDGTIVVRAPDGEYTLERGSVVCFPAGPAGAHKLMNRSESPARTLMFSARECQPSRCIRTATRSSWARRR